MLTINDVKFQQDARKVAKTLLSIGTENITEPYLKTFNYTYSDGDVCYLTILNKVTDANSNNFSEQQGEALIEALLKVDPKNNCFAELDQITEIPMAMALDYMEQETEDFAEEEFDINDMDGFFKRLISLVYTPGVTRLEESPTEKNNFLATNDDATEFKGAFYDGQDRYEFTIKSTGGKWGISYVPDSKTKDKLNKEQNAK